MTLADLDRSALENIALNEAAYVLASTGRCTLPNGFSAPVAIRMPAEGRPFFLKDDPLDIWGFTTTRDGVMYVVFRGTLFTSGLEFAQEWAEDAFSLPLVKFEKGYVHCGFYGAWNPLRGPVEKLTSTAPELVIVGHSLGGAIATQCWAELGGKLMTFGCPRVGDPDFAASLWQQTRVWRYINQHDIVPDVPTDPPFRHGGCEVTVHGPGSILDRKLAHALESYRIGISSPMRQNP